MTRTMPFVRSMHPRARFSLAACGLAVVSVLMAGRLSGRGQDDVTLEALRDDGSVIYARDCASCHGLEGTSDGAGPALDGNARLAAKSHVIEQILKGSPDKGMEAFGKTLDDYDVAAVATYVRNAWNNTFGIVRPADVTPVRAELKIEKAP